MMRPFEGFTPSRAGTREFGDTALRNAGAAADTALAATGAKANIKSAKEKAEQYVASAGRQARSIVDDARTGAITGAITSAIPFGSIAKGFGGGSGPGSVSSLYGSGRDKIDFGVSGFGSSMPDYSGIFR